jgi:two-component system osmolarity sensor histidine kinase EnvZ
MIRIHDTIFLRLALLLLAVVLATQATTYLAVRHFGRGPATELISTLIATRLNPDAARTGEAATTSIRMARGSPPESAAAPRIPFDRELARRLADKLPAGSAIRSSAGPADRTLWVRLGETGEWMRISGIGRVQRLVSILLTTTVIAGLLVLVGAALAARLLTRPLRELATRAPDLVLGKSRSLPGGPWEVRRLARSLEAAAQRRASADRERELLLAGISHDLRAPLARLRLRAQMAGSEAQVEADLDELAAIVDSFIGFVRDGRDEPVRIVALDEWLAEVVQAYRGRGVEFEPPDEAGCLAGIRPLALRRAVVNLIENALEHGSAPVTVTLAGDDGAVRIEVADAGPGLPEPHLESALQPFETFDHSRGVRHGGLGLATVERIARAHGGSLELLNRAAGGLRCVLTLPAGEAASARTD